MTDFHRHMLARAQERLRTARGDLKTFAANIDSRDPLAVQHLAMLKRAVGSAEVEVANAERALEGVQKMQRDVMLGM